MFERVVLAARVVEREVPLRSIAPVVVIFPLSVVVPVPLIASELSVALLTEDSVYVVVDFVISEVASMLTLELFPLS